MDKEKKIELLGMLIHDDYGVNHYTVKYLGALLDLTDLDHIKATRELIYSSTEPSRLILPDESVVEKEEDTTMFAAAMKGLRC